MASTENIPIEIGIRNCKFSNGSFVVIKYLKK